MNNTKYTNKEILSIIVPAFNMNGRGHVMIESTSFCNEHLVEFCDSEPFELIESDEHEGLLSIEFKQYLTECGEECCGYSKYEYTMVTDTITLDILLGKIKIEELC